MEFTGVVCRDAVNDCDIPENCTGNSSQVSMSFPHWSYKLNIGSCSTSQYLWGFLCLFFCSVHQMCTRWMATRVKRIRWDVWQMVIWSYSILHLKKQKKSLHFCTYMSLYRGAALMEGAKPKTDSANTFGEKVSANQILYWQIWTCIVQGLNTCRRGKAVILNVLCVSLRGNSGRQVLLREVKHWRDGERQLWEGQGHLDPV